MQLDAFAFGEPAAVDALSDVHAASSKPKVVLHETPEQLSLAKRALLGTLIGGAALVCGTGSSRAAGVEGEGLSAEVVHLLAASRKKCWTATYGTSLGVVQRRRLHLWDVSNKAHDRVTSEGHHGGACSSSCSPAVAVPPKASTKADRIKDLVKTVDAVLSSFSQFLCPSPGHRFEEVVALVYQAALGTRSGRTACFVHELVALRNARGEKAEDSLAYLSSLPHLSEDELEVDLQIWEVLLERVLHVRSWCRTQLAALAKRPLDEKHVIRLRGHGVVANEQDPERHLQNAVAALLGSPAASVITIEALCVEVKKHLHATNRELSKRPSHHSLDIGFEELSDVCLKALGKSFFEEALEAHRHCMQYFLALRMGGKSSFVLPDVRRDVADALRRISSEVETLVDLSEWSKIDDTLLAFLDMQQTSNDRGRSIADKSEGRIEEELYYHGPIRGATRVRVMDAFGKAQHRLKSLARFVAENVSESDVKSRGCSLHRGIARRNAVKELREICGVSEARLEYLFGPSSNETTGTRPQRLQKLASDFATTEDNLSASEGDADAEKVVLLQYVKPKPTDHRLVWAYARLIGDLRERQEIARRHAGRAEDNLRFKVDWQVARDVARIEKQVHEVEAVKLADLKRRLQDIHEAHAQSVEELNRMRSVAKAEMARYVEMGQVVELSLKIGRLTNVLQAKARHASTCKKEVGKVRKIFDVAVSFARQLRFPGLVADENSMKLTSHPLESSAKRGQVKAGAAAYIDSGGVLSPVVLDGFLQKAAEASSALAASLEHQGVDVTGRRQSLSARLAGHTRQRKSVSVVREAEAAPVATEGVPKSRSVLAPRKTAPASEQWSDIWDGLSVGMGPRCNRVLTTPARGVHALAMAVSAQPAVEAHRLEPLAKVVVEVGDVHTHLNTLTKVAQLLTGYWQAELAARASSHNANEASVHDLLESYFGSKWIGGIGHLARRLLRRCSGLQSAVSAVADLGERLDKVQSSETCSPNVEHCVLVCRDEVLNRTMCMLVQQANLLTSLFEALRSITNLHAIVVVLQRHCDEYAKTGAVMVGGETYELDESQGLLLSISTLRGAVIVREFERELVAVASKPTADTSGSAAGLRLIRSLSRRFQSSPSHFLLHVARERGVLHSVRHVFLNRQLREGRDHLENALRLLHKVAPIASSSRFTNIALQECNKALDKLLEFWSHELCLLQHVSTGAEFRSWRSGLSNLLSGVEAAHVVDIASADDLRDSVNCFEVAPPRAAHLEDWSAVLRAETTLFFRAMDAAEPHSFIICVGSEDLEAHLQGTNLARVSVDGPTWNTAVTELEMRMLTARVNEPVASCDDEIVTELGSDDKDPESAMVDRTTSGKQGLVELGGGKVAAATLAGLGMADPIEVGAEIVSSGFESISFTRLPLKKDSLDPLDIASVPEVSASAMAIAESQQVEKQFGSVSSIGLKMAAHDLHDASRQHKGRLEQLEAAARLFEGASASIFASAQEAADTCEADEAKRRLGEELAQAQAAYENVKKKIDAVRAHSGHGQRSHSGGRRPRNGPMHGEDQVLEMPVGGATVAPRTCPEQPSTDINPTADAVAQEDAVVGSALGEDTGSATTLGVPADSDVPSVGHGAVGSVLSEAHDDGLGVGRSTLASDRHPSQGPPITVEFEAHHRDLGERLAKAETQREQAGISSFERERRDAESKRLRGLLMRAQVQAWPAKFEGLAAMSKDLHASVESHYGIIKMVRGQVKNMQSLDVDKHMDDVDHHQERCKRDMAEWQVEIGRQLESVSKMEAQVGGSIDGLGDKLLEKLRSAQATLLDDLAFFQQERRRLVSEYVELFHLIAERSKHLTVEKVVSPETEHGVALSAGSHSESAAGDQQYKALTEVGQEADASRNTPVKIHLAGAVATLQSRLDRRDRLLSAASLSNKAYMKASALLITHLEEELVATRTLSEYVIATRSEDKAVGFKKADDDTQSCLAELYRARKQSLDREQQFADSVTNIEAVTLQDMETFAAQLDAQSSAVSSTALEEDSGLPEAQRADITAVRKMMTDQQGKILEAKMNAEENKLQILLRKVALAKDASENKWPDSIQDVNGQERGTTRMHAIGPGTSGALVASTGTSGALVASTGLPFTGGPDLCIYRRAREKDADSTGPADFAAEVTVSGASSEMRHRGVATVCATAGADSDKNSDVDACSGRSPKQQVALAKKGTRRLSDIGLATGSPTGSQPSPGHLAQVGRTKGQSTLQDGFVLEAKSAVRREEVSVDRQEQERKKAAEDEVEDALIELEEHRLQVLQTRLETTRLRRSQQRLAEEQPDPTSASDDRILFPEFADVMDLLREQQDAEEDGEMEALSIQVDVERLRIEEMKFRRKLALKPHSKDALSVRKLAFISRAGRGSNLSGKPSMGKKQREKRHKIKTFGSLIAHDGVESDEEIEAEDGSETTSSPSESSREADTPALSPMSPADIEFALGRRFSGSGAHKARGQVAPADRRWSVGGADANPALRRSVDGATTTTGTSYTSPVAAAWRQSVAGRRSSLPALATLDVASIEKSLENQQDGGLGADTGSGLSTALSPSQLQRPAVKSVLRHAAIASPLSQISRQVAQSSGTLDQSDLAARNHMVDHMQQQSLEFARLAEEKVAVEVRKRDLARQQLMRQQESLMQLQRKMSALRNVQSQPSSDEAPSPELVTTTASGDGSAQPLPQQTQQQQQQQELSTEPRQRKRQKKSVQADLGKLQQMLLMLEKAVGKTELLVSQSKQKVVVSEIEVKQAERMKDVIKASSHVENVLAVDKGKLAEDEDPDEKQDLNMIRLGHAAKTAKKKRTGLEVPRTVTNLSKGHRLAMQMCRQVKQPTEEGPAPASDVLPEDGSVAQRSWIRAIAFSAVASASGNEDPPVVTAETDTIEPVVRTDPSPERFDGWSVIPALPVDATVTTKEIIHRKMNVDQVALMRRLQEARERTKTLSKTNADPPESVEVKGSKSGVTALDDHAEECTADEGDLGDGEEHLSQSFMSESSSASPGDSLGAEARRKRRIRLPPPDVEQVRFAEDGSDYSPLLFLTSGKVFGRSTREVHARASRRGGSIVGNGNGVVVIPVLRDESIGRCIFAAPYSSHKLLPKASTTGPIFRYLFASVLAKPCPPELLDSKRLLSFDDEDSEDSEVEGKIDDESDPIRIKVVFLESSIDLIQQTTLFTPNGHMDLGRRFAAVGAVPAEPTAVSLLSAACDALDLAGGRRANMAALKSEDDLSPTGAGSDVPLSPSSVGSPFNGFTTAPPTLMLAASKDRPLDFFRKGTGLTSNNFRFKGSWDNPVVLRGDDLSAPLPPTLLQASEPRPPQHGPAAERHVRRHLARAAPLGYRPPGRSQALVVLPAIGLAVPSETSDAPNHPRPSAWSSAPPLPVVLSARAPATGAGSAETTFDFGFEALRVDKVWRQCVRQLKPQPDGNGHALPHDRPRLARGSGENAAARPSMHRTRAQHAFPAPARKRRRPSESFRALIS